jgi:hypothetical protein
MRKLVTVAALLASAAPLSAADNAPPSYLETLANCRRIILAGIDSPGCASLVAARDAEPRAYTGNADLSVPVYSMDEKTFAVQHRAASAEHVARIRAESAERIAAERNAASERIATERNATTRGVARFNAERATITGRTTRR